MASIRRHRLHDDMFLAEVELTIGKAEEENAKHLQGFVQPQSRTEKDGSEYREYRIHVESSDDFYALLHESLHLVKWIMEDRGIPFTAKNDEVIAYMQSYWFKKLWRKMNKKKK